MERSTEQKVDIKIDQRPARTEDIPSIVAMIDIIDDDDAEACEHDFRKHGIDDHWVAFCGSKLVGVSGFRLVNNTIGSGWLSWTYVHPEFQRQGIAQSLLITAINSAKEKSCYQLFVKVSNYIESSGVSTYANAIRLYEKNGFEFILKNPELYDAKEDQLIYRLILSNEDRPEIKDEKPNVKFTGIFELVESDGAYTFDWDVKKNPLWGSRSFSKDDLLIGLQAVKEQGGRVVFLTFPSNWPLIHKPLQEAGFKFIGELENYYEPGVDEMHFCHDLGGI